MYINISILYSGAGVLTKVMYEALCRVLYILRIYRGRGARVPSNVVHQPRARRPRPQDEALSSWVFLTC